MLEGIALMSTTFSTDYSLSFKQTVVTIQRGTKPLNKLQNKDPQ